MTNGDDDSRGPWEGRTIKRVRPMTEEELRREGWAEDQFGSTPRYMPPVVEFEDGSTLFASRDPEGNGPGAMFGSDPDGQGIWLPPPDSPAAQG